MIPAIHGGHVHETPARELTDQELSAVALSLAGQGLNISPAVDVFRHVHLWSLEPTTTVQEVTALRAFAAVTDARLVWHGLVA